MTRKPISKSHVPRKVVTDSLPVSPPLPVVPIPEAPPVVQEVPVAVEQVVVAEVPVKEPEPRDPKLAVGDEIHKTLRKSLPNPLISMTDLVPLTVRAMNLAQKQRMKGSDKKRLVLHALNLLVSEVDLLAEDAKLHARVFVESQLPLLVDSLVTAANNPYSLGKVSPGTCCGCF